MSRLFLDVSTLSRWSGPPVGMIRVESELARLAAAMTPPAEPVFYDPVRKAFRRLSPGWRDRLLGWHAILDTWKIDYFSHETGWRRAVPSRQPIMRVLERRRLLTRSPFMAGAMEALQRLVLGVRAHGTPFRAADGTRIAMIPADLALGEAVTFAAGDTLFSAASDWGRKDPEELRAMKQASGCRIVVVCYDIIPLTHPRFFPAADVAIFQAYWEKMFTVADRVIVNAGAIRRDVETWCVGAGLAPPQLSVVPLGADPVSPAAGTPLPEGLEPDRYALFVSTIEPRKNHALLLDAWEALLARGIPQAHRFRLVFVGRAGWMVDHVIRRLAEPAAFAGTVTHLRNMDDARLQALYAGCAFCLYPSFHEGFGLPVVEAHAHGKAVLASNGGALAEVAGALSPTLDPDDTAGWAAAMEEWIGNPEARRAAEAVVRARFRPRPWSDVARDMLAAAAD